MIASSWYDSGGGSGGRRGDLQVQRAEAEKENDAEGEAAQQKAEGAPGRVERTRAPAEGLSGVTRRNVEESGNSPTASRRRGADVVAARPRI